MPQHEFIPSCPTCQYDLRGTPKNRCPECGQSFNRAKVFDPTQALIIPPDPPGANVLLVGAVIVGMFGYAYSRPYADAKQLAQIAVIWALASGWVYLRRRSIFGPRPCLVLWLILVAIVAPLRPGLGPPFEYVATGLSLLVGLAAIIYPVSRRPFETAQVLLFTVAVITSFLGLMIALYALQALIFRIEHDGYSLYGLHLDAGRRSDLIIIVMGLAHIAIGFALFALADRLRNWQQRRTLRACGS